MPDCYKSITTVQSTSFYRRYHSGVVIPDLVSSVANRRQFDFYRRYYTGVVLPELFDHPILGRILNIQDSQASLPNVNWLTIAYMWDVDWESFVESSS